MLLKNSRRSSNRPTARYGITNLDRTLLEAGLVNEYQLWMVPKAMGRGKRAFEDIDPSLLKLDLVGTHRFKNGVVALSYVPR
jgi:dihydrofolate reductase